MDYFVDFTAAYFGDGLSHTHAASEGAPGCWNAISGHETVIYSTLAAGDKIWIRRVGLNPPSGGNAIWMQYLDTKVAWIGWPEGSDEFFATRPGTGAPSPDPRTDWDPDCILHEHADITYLAFGSNQLFHRLHMSQPTFSDYTQGDCEFVNCEFDGYIEFPGDAGVSQIPHSNYFKFCVFNDLILMTDCRDICFVLSSFRMTSGVSTRQIDALRSHGVVVYGSSSVSGVLPFYFHNCGGIEIYGYNGGMIEFDTCSGVHVNAFGNHGGQTYGINLINCTGAINLTDSRLSGTGADLRVQGHGATLNCRHLELVHDTVAFSPASSTWTPNSFPMLNISEYDGDPTDYRSWQWGGEIRSDTTIYRHGSYPVSYRLEPSTLLPNWCPRLMVNTWGLEMTYMDQEPYSYFYVAVHGLHEGWPQTTLHANTIWGETDCGDLGMAGWGFQGRRFTWLTRTYRTKPWNRQDLIEDPNSTWENQGSMTPFVIYVPIMVQHGDPVNLRIPIRVVLATFSGAKKIWIDPIPRISG